MADRRIQQIFEELAAGYQLLGKDGFRVAAMERVARLLRDSALDFEKLVREHGDAEKRLQEIPGIGAGSARRIVEIVETGGLEEHDRLLEQVPRGLFRLLEVPGIGPKTAKALWTELGVTSMDDLRAALSDDRAAELPRLGKKTVENLREALEFDTKTANRVPIGRALPLAREIVRRLRATTGAQQVEAAGSLRRGRETIGDLDFVACGTRPEALRTTFLELPGISKVLAHGDTKCSVRVERGGVQIQADLRIVEKRVFGAALLYFTGSKAHAVRLRELAIRKGMHLNEYGLFSGTDARPQDRGERPLAASTEDAIYRKLGLDPVPPEQRQDRPLDDVVRELVTLDDLRAELHSHTTASDGRLGIREMAEIAKSRGFHTLAITDHSQSSAIARGLTPERLKSHVRAVRRANEELDGIQLLAGAEVDIRADGALDYEDELLAGLDLVVASPHQSLRQSGAAATRRILAAIQHPDVDIIGHPTGRKVGGRRGLELDIEAVCAAAAEHDTALEINANPRRLDLRDSHVAAAVAHGCLLAINTDAHSERDFDFLEYGVLTARRGGLSAKRCVNAWSADELGTWLRR